jgi:hypothetical protein
MNAAAWAPVRPTVGEASRSTGGRSTASTGLVPVTALLTRYRYQLEIVDSRRAADAVAMPRHRATAYASTSARVAARGSRPVRSHQAR